MRIFLLLFFAFSFSSPSFAQAEQKDRTNDFVFNNSLFILYHEIGHLLISELDIPVLGREENVADNFATLELLKIESDEANNILIDSANGWFLSSIDQNDDIVSREAFYSEHSLDVQRAFQIVCLMVGKDREVFKQVAVKVGIDELRQESCYYDYILAQESWEKVLKPHKKSVPSDLNIRAFYDRGTGSIAIRKLLQENKLLENAMNGVLREYNFPNKFNLRAKNCGEANAFYDSWVSELLFCYELAEYFDAIFNEDSLAIKLSDPLKTPQDIEKNISQPKKKTSDDIKDNDD